MDTYFVKYLSKKSPTSLHGCGQRYCNGTVKRSSIELWTLAMPSKWFFLHLEKKWLNHWFPCCNRRLVKEETSWIWEFIHALRNIARATLCYIIRVQTVLVWTGFRIATYNAIKADSAWPECVLRKWKYPFRQNFRWFLRAENAYKKKSYKSVNKIKQKMLKPVVVILCLYLAFTLCCK